MQRIDLTVAHQSRSTDHKSTRLIKQCRKETKGFPLNANSVGGDHGTCVISTSRILALKPQRHRMNAKNRAIFWNKYIFKVNAHQQPEVCRKGGLNYSIPYPLPTVARMHVAVRGSFQVLISMHYNEKELQF